MPKPDSSEHLLTPRWRDGRERFRTVFISDTHLGSRAARSVELAAFLKRIECEKLYLVGDIIDFWRLRSKSYWPPCHHKVMRRVLKLAQKGTEVVFIPGNHDEAARTYVGTDFGGIRIERDDVHETFDGRRLLITHGDEFDMVCTHSRLVSMLGGVAYEWLVLINRWYNGLRTRLGLPRKSFSQYVKGKVKKACQFISAFEDTLVNLTVDRGLDGVVCGHIHKAEAIDGDVQYFNCGDWVEACSALVEHADGTMEIVFPLIDSQPAVVPPIVDPRHARPAPARPVPAPAPVHLEPVMVHS